jgi:hypothetical protein
MAAEDDFGAADDGADGGIDFLPGGRMVKEALEFFAQSIQPILPWLVGLRRVKVRLVSGADTERTIGAGEHPAAAAVDEP